MHSRDGEVLYRRCGDSIHHHLRCHGCKGHTEEIAAQVGAECECSQPRQMRATTTWSSRSSSRAVAPHAGHAISRSSGPLTRRAQSLSAVVPSGPSDVESFFAKQLSRSRPMFVHVASASSGLSYGSARTVTQKSPEPEAAPVAAPQEDRFRVPPLVLLELLEYGFFVPCALVGFEPRLLGAQLHHPLISELLLGDAGPVGHVRVQLLARRRGNVTAVPRRVGCGTVGGRGGPRRLDVGRLDAAVRSEEREPQPDPECEDRDHRDRSDDDGAGASPTDAVLSPAK